MKQKRLSQVAPYNQTLTGNLSTRKISFPKFSSKMCNLCKAGTTTVLVEYKTLKQISRFHFSQKDQVSNFFENTWSFCVLATKWK